MSYFPQPSSFASQDRSKKPGIWLQEIMTFLVLVLPEDLIVTIINTSFPQRWQSHHFYCEKSCRSSSEIYCSSVLVLLTQISSAGTRSSTNKNTRFQITPTKSVHCKRITEANRIYKETGEKKQPWDKLPLVHKIYCRGGGTKTCLVFRAWGVWVFLLAVFQVLGLINL